MELINSGNQQPYRKGSLRTDDDRHLALELVRFRVLGKPYSAWRAIVAQAGESDTAFLIALAQQGIAIDKAKDPMLFCAQDIQQMRLLSEEGVTEPTMLQIALTSKAWGLSDHDVQERMTAILTKMQEPEAITS